MHIPPHSALLLIDLQNDFCPGGSLAVDHGDKVIAVANELMSQFDLVVATQDWHPAGHHSFASQYPGKHPGDMIDLRGVEQTLWPDHCIQGSDGAAFHSALKLAGVDKIIQKGTHPEVDSYSAFFDNARLQQTELDEYLKDHQVENIIIMGLATDYCVKFSCLDAVSLGYSVSLVEKGCRGVELSEGDVVAALAELKAAGVVIL